MQQYAWRSSLRRSSVSTLFKNFHNDTQTFPMPSAAIAAVLIPGLGIGHDGCLPWHRPLDLDLKFFEQATSLNHDNTTNIIQQLPCEPSHQLILFKNIVLECLVMCRTWQSLEAPLTGRLTLVLTTKSEYSGLNAKVTAQNALKRLMTVHPEKINDDEWEKILAEPIFIDSYESLRILCNTSLLIKNTAGMLYFCGGEKVYTYVIKDQQIADKIYITRVIFKEKIKTDVFFPFIPHDAYDIVRLSPKFNCSKTASSIDFIEFQKNTNFSLKNQKKGENYYNLEEIENNDEKNFSGALRNKLLNKSLIGHQFLGALFKK